VWFQLYSKLERTGGSHERRYSTVVKDNNSFCSMKKIQKIIIIIFLMYQIPIQNIFIIHFHNKIFSSFFSVFFFFFFLLSSSSSSTPRRSSFSTADSGQKVSTHCSDWRSLNTQLLVFPFFVLVFSEFCFLCR